MVMTKIGKDKFNYTFGPHGKRLKYDVNAEVFFTFDSLLILILIILVHTF